MTPNLKIWQPHFEEVEGRINHFYLDGDDNVTIGIGCMITAPTLLSMFHKGDGLPATLAEIISDYNAIKAMRGGSIPQVYNCVARLFITESLIDSLFLERLAQSIGQIEVEGIDLENAPDSAALAIVDMAFNLGTHGLIKKFPKFLNAFKNHDWHICALECKREGIQTSRNDWTRAIFDALDQSVINAENEGMPA